MADTLPYTSDCCQPCESPTTVQVPGPAGSNGANGANGADGVNAYTALTAAFTMPAEAGTVSASVGSTAWMVVGQILYVQTAGYMIVSSITNANTVVLSNPENTASSLYLVNAAPATNIPAASKVAPGGIQGPAGTLSGAAGGSLEGTYPNPTLAITTTVGDIIVNNNAAVAPRNTRLAAGANGSVLHSDNTQPTGRRQSAIDLSGTNTLLSGALAIASGGTGQTGQTAAFNALSPLTTRGDLLTRDGTNNIRKAIGTANQVFTSDGTDPQWAKLVAANLGTALSVLAVDYILIRYELASGTNGGDFTSGAWQTRPLNTETADTGSHASLAANQITLSAGTYRFRAGAVGYQVGTHQARLQNITAGTTTAYGIVVRCINTDDNALESQVMGRFTIAGATVFELQHRCTVTNAGDGMGTPGTFGNAEVYAWIEFEREAA